MSPAKPDAANTANEAGKKSFSCTRIRRTFGRSGTARLRLVAGDARFVDFVDLLRVEEHLRVALVDLAAHEDVEQIRVDVVAELHLAQDLERLGERLALLVGPVL